MKHLLMSGVIAASACLSLPAFAEAMVGLPAPAFSGTDTNGKTHQLSDYKGRYLVLEWVNPGCPFVRKHYSGNMQATQNEAKAKGAVWLAVNSTAESQSDYHKPADLAKWMQSKNAAVNATLMDTSGEIGKAFGAKVTPHMYIIDPKGTLVYAGAIDSKPTARVDDIKDATNYVKQALSESQSGKPVSVATTNAYGCTVKYAN